MATRAPRPAKVLEEAQLGQGASHTGGNTAQCSHHGEAKRRSLTPLSLKKRSQVQDASGSERLQPKTYRCNARIPEPGRKRWWLLGRCCEQEDTLDSEAYGHDEAEDGC